MHFWEVWADGVNFNFAVDGVLVFVADAAPSSESATAFLLGDHLAADNPMSGFHSRYAIASAPPSAAQRAQLLGTAKYLDGF